MAHHNNAQHLIIQNRTALAILFAGLFFGSLFVDITHFVRGDGFSQKAIRGTSVIAHDGRTWVAYTDQPLPVTLLTSADCGDACNADQVLTWLRYTMPTIDVRSVDIATPDGRALAERYDIVALPALLFEAQLTATPFYQQAHDFFTQRNDRYLLHLRALGKTPGQYIATPQADEGIAMGSANPQERITFYADLTCASCVMAHKRIAESLSHDKNAIQYIFVPVGTSDARVAHAAHSIRCAAENNDNTPAYITEIFTRQREWRTRTDDTLFLAAARHAGIENLAVFRACLTRHTPEEEQATMAGWAEQARRFGVIDGPGVFVNNVFLDGSLKGIDVRHLAEELDNIDNIRRGEETKPAEEVL